MDNYFNLNTFLNKNFFKLLSEVMDSSHKNRLLYNHLFIKILYLPYYHIYFFQKEQSMAQPEK